MARIVINEKIAEVRKVEKVRLLSIVGDTLVVAAYAGHFMLPGGKVDKDENLEDALVREVEEETGVRVDKDEFAKLVTVDNYQERYPNASGIGFESRHIKTHYYITDTLLPIDKKSHLSKREQDGNYTLMQINISDLIKILESKNGSEQEICFAKELLEVLKYYLRYIDLHVHTLYSDGEYDVDDVINLARKQGLRMIGITDHDTLEGIKRVDKTKYPDIEIIDGIELSAKVDHGRMHILGYGIDINDVRLNRRLKEVKQININTIMALIAQLYDDYFLRFKDFDIEQMIQSNNNLGRPHVAQLCVDYGYASSIQDAFDKYLVYSYHKLGDRKKGLPYEECISLISDSGGIPILAHPKTLKLTEKELYVKLSEMVDVGLRGLEVYHSSQTEEERQLYLRMAQEYNLLISGGTDYHGPSVKPDVDLATGCDNNVCLRYVPLLNAFNKR